MNVSEMSSDFQYVVEGLLNPNHLHRFTTKQVLEEFKPVYRLAQRKRIYHYYFQKVK